MECLSVCGSHRFKLELRRLSLFLGCCSLYGQLRGRPPVSWTVPKEVANRAHHQADVALPPSQGCCGHQEPLPYLGTSGSDAAEGVGDVEGEGLGR